MSLARPIARDTSVFAAFDIIISEGNKPPKDLPRKEEMAKTEAPMKMPALETDEKPRVTFDEHVIAEHDLDRGTRMKIDEPETPFARRRRPKLFDDEDDDDDDVAGAQKGSATK